MTQEEKDLLLKDLCARLPYKVKAMYSKHEETIIAGEYERIDAEGVEVIDGYLDDYCFRIDGYKIHISSIKPYLRSMSSMTEEEQKEFGNLAGLWKDQSTFRFINCLPNLSGEFAKTLISEIIVAKAIDWLNEHHFDYRGLVPMGLALEAPEGMY
jgi:hypothetical protein